MAKNSYTLHPISYTDPSRTTVAGGRQQGIDTFDGLWNRRAEGVYSLEKLATVIAYIQLGMADVEFPRTSRSGPSDLVLVVAVPATQSKGLITGESLLPFPVNWRIWHNIVVPILSDPAWQINNMFSRIVNGLRQRASVAEDFRRYCYDLQVALRKGAQATGIIPPGNKGEASSLYRGLFETNNIPERRCCCPDPDCCEE